MVDEMEERPQKEESTDYSPTTGWWAHFFFRGLLLSPTGAEYVKKGKKPAAARRRRQFPFLFFFYLVSYFPSADNNQIGLPLRAAGEHFFAREELALTTEQNGIEVNGRNAACTLPIFPVVG